MATFTMLLATRIVPKSRSESLSKRSNTVSEGFLWERTCSKCAGVREKKATSLPDIRADAKSNNTPPVRAKATGQVRGYTAISEK